jgi:hypothetical protein
MDDNTSPWMDLESAWYFNEARVGQQKLLPG